MMVSVARTSRPVAPTFSCVGAAGLRFEAGRARYLSCLEIYVVKLIQIQHVDIFIHPPKMSHQKRMMPRGGMYLYSADLYDTNPALPG